MSEEFHLRMSSELNRQVEHEVVLRRTSKNALLCGIIQRTLNPNPDDEATIFRRLDRVEKALHELTKVVHGFRQSLHAIEKDTGALVESIRGVEKDFSNAVHDQFNNHVELRQSLQRLHHDIGILHAHVDIRISSVIQTEEAKTQQFLRDLAVQAGTEGRTRLGDFGRILKNVLTQDNTPP